MSGSQYLTLVLFVLVVSFSHAEWSPGGRLPFNLMDTSLTSNDQFMFYAGGRDTYTHSKMVYMVNITGYTSYSNMKWKLSVGRSAVASAILHNKVYFAGGDTDNDVTDLVEIFDIFAEEWTTARLSRPRGGPTAAVVGDSILFVGGRDTSYNDVPSDVIDIYHAKNNSWTTATLTNPRRNLAVAVIGSRAFFAGGFPIEYSDVVEIYDADTESWSQDKLSLKRTGLAAVGLGDLAFFAGGDAANGITDRIDIFYGSNNTWGRAKLSVPRTRLAAGSAGDQVLFVAGSADEPTRAYIADIMFLSGRWETVPLPNSGGGGWLATTSRNRIYFYAPGFSYAMEERWWAWNGTTGIRPVAPPRTSVPYSYNPNLNQPAAPQSSRISSSILLDLNGWISLAVIAVCFLI